MSLINQQNVRQAEKLSEELQPLKQKIEQRINLDKYSDSLKSVVISNNMLQRIALFAGLSLQHERSLDKVKEIQLHAGGNSIHPTTFSRLNLAPLWSALLKLRYHHLHVDWEDSPIRSRIINYEMLQGALHLQKDGVMEEWLLNNLNFGKSGGYGDIPQLKLNIGHYEDDIQALLDLNSRNISNTQILIAGSTGSGKSNLLAVLIQEMRSLSVETSYPVNFLLFDYKGEFSDPANNEWLSYFDIERDSILNPIVAPLPFTPFKDFTGKPQNEINLYSTEMANALCSIDNVRISANMSNRLSQAIINAYRITDNKAITFQIILSQYETLKDDDRTDSIQSVLMQLIRTNLFETSDKIDLINGSYIVKMDGFPKDGPLAKAIVYFIVSKLNSIYEKLPKQAVNDDCVEIRHFTIIDEAHYMLGFDNKPLRDLIAIGRNKGLSIILATQNMDAYMSEHFDFYANAQYPLIMKQQTMNDSVIKGLFGVSGKEFQEIKEAISGLRMGELIIKNPTAVALGMGKKYKKIKVRHLI